MNVCVVVHIVHKPNGLQERTLRVNEFFIDGERGQLCGNMRILKKFIDSLSYTLTLTPLMHTYICTHMRRCDYVSVRSMSLFEIGHPTVTAYSL